MQATIRLGRIAGIEIGIHYTWIFAFALITWSLAAGFFPILYPGWSTGTYWLVGAVASALLFVSVLVHEMAHSLVAVSRGIPVESITLFIFGGVSGLRAEARDPRDELLIAGVGPASSLLLAGFFFLLFVALRGAPEQVTALLGYLALINGLLGVFNLLPGFPLDGGRLLRGAVWQVTGDLVQATNVAAGAGQLLAFLLIVWGLFQFFQANFLGGIWSIFLGWFLSSAAQQGREQVALQEALRGVPVATVFRRDVVTVPPQLSLRQLVDDYVLRRGLRAFPVVEDGRLMGIITITDIRRVPSEAWDRYTVAQVMTRDPLWTVRPSTQLLDALRLLAEQDVDQLLVVEDGSLAGVLTRSAVLRFLRLQTELGYRGRPAEEERRRAA